MVLKAKNRTYERGRLTNTKYKIQVRFLLQTFILYIESQRMNNKIKKLLKVSMDGIGL